MDMILLKEATSQYGVRKEDDYYVLFYQGFDTFRIKHSHNKWTYENLLAQTPIARELQHTNFIWFKPILEDFNKTNLKRLLTN